MKQFGGLTWLPIEFRRRKGLMTRLGNPDLMTTISTQMRQSHVLSWLSRIVLTDNKSNLYTFS